MIRRLTAAPRESVHPALMLALTFSTGVVDAVCYLGLDRVFTANMTGNVLILGMGIAGAEDLTVAGPLLALIGFLTGAALGGRTLKDAEAGWTPRTTLLFGLVATLLLVVAVLLLAVGDDFSRPARLTITVVLGIAMGVQAATARFLAVKDVTTVVVTSTITGLAAESVLGSGKGAARSLRRVTAVLLLLAGAATGAALLTWAVGSGLVLSGVITAVVTVLGALHAHQHAP